MGVLSALFSFEGRLSRIDFWRRGNLLALPLAVVIAGTIFATMTSPFGPFVALLLLPFPIVSLSMAARRLHDRNKSAWWLVLFMGAPAALATAASVLLEAPRPDGNVALTLAVAAWVIVVWAVIELNFLSGSSRANRFGPPPRRAARRRATRAA